MLEQRYPDVLDDVGEHARIQVIVGDRHQRHRDCRAAEKNQDMNQRLEVALDQAFVDEILRRQRK
jgi:hypothetical protein